MQPTNTSRSRRLPGLGFALLLLALGPCPPLAAADHGFEINALSLYKDYNGSVEKKSGLEQHLFLSKEFDRFKLGLGYQYATAERYQPRDLRVTKLSLSAGLRLSKDVDVLATYLEIDDNIAPTDGGKVYSATLGWRGLPQRLSTRLGVHYSDYDSFHVTQFGLNASKAMRLGGLGINLAAGARYIEIGREGHPAYVAHAEDSYFAPQVMLTVGRGGYYGRIGVIGKRAFEVADEGRRVSHHAMELRRSYILAVGRKMKALDLQFLFTHNLATELPPSNDLNINTFALGLNYRF